jgi:hypothetical protein
LKPFNLKMPCENVPRFDFGYLKTDDEESFKAGTEPPSL